VSLSPPQRLDLTPREVDTLERVAQLLHELGIEVEPFGGRSYVLRALPQALEDQRPVELVADLIQEAAHLRGNQEEQRERLAMKAACLGAVKAGDPLTIQEAQKLLDDLAIAWSPATCPHGRPAIVAISMEELARRFGR
jgi:DNA mismatch repair protein MutL